MRQRHTCITLFLGLLLSITIIADQKAFLGRWNLSGTSPNSDRVYWLEVKEENGKLSAMFLNRGGSPVRIDDVRLEGDELVLQMQGRANNPGPTIRLRADGVKASGTITSGTSTVNVTGLRPPRWENANANGNHTYGTPIVLFDGKSLDAFGVQNKSQPMGWSIEDGVMTNAEHANNLVSKEKFKDFKIHAEYKLGPHSNSGIYLRGRYELQVLDDYGKPADEHGHMAIYAWKAPRVNASKPPGEWQAMEAVVVGNRVTVTLNGQRVHDNAVLEAITGGAIDANEAEPGPIMIQGDHERVWFRNVTVTPITKPGR
jgi:hypothetical protein